MEHRRRYRVARVFGRLAVGKELDVVVLQGVVYSAINGYKVAWVFGGCWG